MGNGGFWIFVVIVVANLVITAIKKSAEKKAAANAASSGRGVKPAAAKRMSLSGKGDLEVILERVGDRSFDVMTVLRETACMSLDAASDACVSPPAVVGTNLTRSEAGMIRQALEGVGAGASIRRVQRSSFQAAVAEPVRAVEQTLERAMRSVERSIEGAVASASPAATSTTRSSRTDQAPSRIEALRTPPAPPTPAKRPTRREFAPRADTSRRSSPTEVATPSAVQFPTLPEIGAISPTARGRSAAATRLRATLGRPEALRDAFLLQELLRPPLSERSGGVGGR